MRRTIWLAPLLLLAGLPVFAGPLNYDIVFKTSTGLSPAAGSFVFDSDLSNPNPFSNFIVVWDTIAFDFTSIANSFGTQGFFNPCTTSTPSANGTACGEASGTWDEGDLWIGAVSDWAHAQHSFTLNICGTRQCQSLESISSVFAPQVTGEGTGDFNVVVTLQSTPEPGTIAMMLMAAMAAAMTRRERILRTLRLRPALSNAPRR